MKNSKSRFHFFMMIVIFQFAFMPLIISQGLAASDKPIKWKVLTSWGPNYKPYEYQLVRWMNAINKELKGRLQVTAVGPEAVPPFEQLKPLRAGIFDVLWTHSAYHAGDIGLGIGMDLFFASAADRERAGAHAIVDEAYRKTQNAHYLSSFPDGTGYHLMLRDKCIDKADLKGFKLRSNAFYDPLLGTLGAATVKMAGGEVYSSLEKGVVDGSTWPAFGALDFKWYEVAKYMVRPRFGETVTSFLVNLDQWNRLGKDLQEKVTKITLKVADDARDAMMKQWAGEEKELIKLGMKECILPPEEASKFLSTFNKETWKFVKKLSPEYGPKLQKIANKFD